MTLHKIICRIGKTDKVRGGESGYNRNGDNDRIDIVVKHPERHSQRGDDEREFTDLREREARLHRYAQRLSGDEHSESAEDNHAHNHHA